MIFLLHDLVYISTTGHFASVNSKFACLTKLNLETDPFICLTCGTDRFCGLLGMV